MARTVIDPVTRANGPLRVELALGAGVITDAWVSGTMYRGIERVMRGRDPRDTWLFAQRICGSCDTVHALAAVRATERALEITIPQNARIIRNMLAAVQAISAHVSHFYTRQAYDYIDVAAAATADPKKTTDLAQQMGALTRSSVATFQGVKDRVARVLASGQHAPFGGGWWGHPAYTISPEASLLVLSHALDALDWNRRALRLHAIFGGKSPHPQTYTVGGMVVTPVWSGPYLSRSGEHPALPDKDSVDPFTSRGQQEIANIIEAISTFVEQSYLPDVKLLLGSYPEWTRFGQGIGNYLSVGDYALDDKDSPTLLFGRGRLMDRDLANLYHVDQEAIEETVAASWYAEADGSTQPKRPIASDASPAYAGPSLSDPMAGFATLEGAAKYSWVKGPRYVGQAMEVGPLARLLVTTADPSNGQRDRLLKELAAFGLERTTVPGAYGRTVARAIEARILAERLEPWRAELQDRMAEGFSDMVDVSRWATETWPKTASGVGLVEGPRGTVGHWMDLSDGTVANYHVIDASTWNLSPRDADGRRGALEQALIGTPIADPKRPLEALRMIHSFDPCGTCAVHAHGDGAPIEITVR